MRKTDIESSLSMTSDAVLVKLRGHHALAGSAEVHDPAAAPSLSQLGRVAYSLARCGR